MSVTDDQTPQLKVAKTGTDYFSKGTATAYLLSAVCVALIVVVVLFCLGVLQEFGADSNATSEAKRRDFPTPQSAIEHFVDALNRSDTKGMLAACGVNEMAAGFDFESSAATIGTFNTSYLPPQYDEYRLRNEHYVSYQRLTDIAFLRLAVLLSEEDLETFLVARPADGDRESIDKFVALTNPENFPQVEIVKYGTSRLKESPYLVKVRQDYAEGYGAIDTTSLAVLYRIGEDYYAGSFTLLRYDENWYIANLLSSEFTPKNYLDKLQSDSDFEEWLDSSK